LSVTTFAVALVLKGRSHAVDEFFKYQGEHLPEVGDVIRVVRFVRGRPLRARVIRVSRAPRLHIEAAEID
jgi:hypothetical protein